jgi:hypothetical protein
VVESEILLVLLSCRGELLLWGETTLEKVAYDLGIVRVLLLATLPTSSVEPLMGGYHTLRIPILALRVLDRLLHIYS